MGVPKPWAELCSAFSAWRCREEIEASDGREFWQRSRPGCGLPQRLAARFRCGLDSRGETPPELAGEDARATICPRREKDSVQMRPLVRLCSPGTEISLKLKVQSPKPEQLQVTG